MEALAIWKYLISETDQRINIPKEHKILKVGLDKEKDLSMWALVNPDSVKIKIHLLVVDTGAETLVTFLDTYLGSVVFANGTTQHIFKLL